MIALSPTSVSRRLAALGAVAAMGASALLAVPAQAADDVTINLIGINDFHGRIDSNTVKFAGTVEQVRQQGGEDSSLLISAGDNVSASLFASAVQDDIPTIDVLNALDLDASAAGNHEFDQGAADLTGRLSDAADFPFLAANVFKADGSRLLDPYKLFTIKGVSVAVVGALTEETSALVSPAGIQGLAFTDPTDAINDTVDDLEALPAPPQVIVASIHEGAPDGTQSYEQNATHSAVFAKIAQQTDPAVDAIFMGHTHQAYTYDAPIPGEPGKTRPLIQTGSYGSNVGNVQLTVDPETGDVASYTQRIVARTTVDDGTLTSTFGRVAQVKTVVDAALAFAAEKGNEPIGTQTDDITTAYAGGSRDDRGSESTLGNLVADALLSKVSTTGAGADLGIVNPGGLRADLTYAGTTGTNKDGVITYAEANSVLPFVNQLNTVTLSGASVKKILEQQWQRDATGNVPTRAYLQLGLSKNASYTFDPTLPEGSRITGVRINGAPLDPAKSYKVATFSFLATGGDNFRAFTEGTSVDTGLVDYEAWIDYLRDSSPVTPDFARRTVQATGLQPAYDEGATVSLSLPRLDLTSLGSPQNSSVAVSLVQGDTVTALGDFPVTAGAASPTLTLPKGITGTAHLVVTATPSGTKAELPAFDIKKVKLASTVKAVALPFIPQGARTPVAVQVTSAGARPTGVVTVSEGDKTLGTTVLRKGIGLVVADTRGLGPGSHTLTVTYAGDDTHAPDSATVRVAVLKGFGGGR